MFVWLIVLVCLFVCLFVCLVVLFVWLFCLFVCLFACLFVCLFVCPPTPSLGGACGIMPPKGPKTRTDEGGKGGVRG